MENRLLDLMLKRRSIRKYTGEAISDEALEMIINAGLAAPKGRSLNSVELVVVKDRKTLEALSRCRAHGPGMLAAADACIVVFGNEDVQDVWTEDCSIAMTMMHLMADSLGIGSCWVQGRLRTSPDGGTADDVVRTLLDVPSNFRLEAMLSLGMPAEEKEAHSLDELNRASVHMEKF